MRKRTLILFLICIILISSFGCESKGKESNPLISVEESNPIISVEEPGKLTSVAEPNSLALDDTTSNELITLGFTGDINFDENWPTMEYYHTTSGLCDCIAPSLLDLTSSFTLFMTNNEFTYSTRGTPMNGKMYTFRADPTRISLLEEMGTDVVLLANNHIFDYGEDAFYDTLDTLESADIDYIGAGRNLDEADNILYYNYGDITLAYTAATQAEKNILTPEAGENTPGVLRCYDSTAFLAQIKEAADNSDFVVANVHWGTEYSNDVTDQQHSLAYEMIDAGADVIIGTHPHVLQGVEYYKNKPIFYSLGNYWFNEKTLYSCVLELNVNTKSAAVESVRFYPCIQANCKTYLAKGDEALSVYNFMQDISFNVSFDSSGSVTPVNPQEGAPSSRE